MKIKSMIKITLATIIIMIDIILANAFDAFMMLFNSKSAVRALSNDDTSYIISQTVLINPTLFYVILGFINLILFLLIIGVKKPKKKIEDKGSEE